MKITKEPQEVVKASWQEYQDLNCIQMIECHKMATY